MSRDHYTAPSSAHAPHRPWAYQSGSEHEALSFRHVHDAGEMVAAFSVTIPNVHDNHELCLISASSSSSSSSASFFFLHFLFFHLLVVVVVAISASSSSSPSSPCTHSHRYRHRHRHCDGGQKSLLFLTRFMSCDMTQDGQIKLARQTPDADGENRKKSGEGE